MKDKIFSVLQRVGRSFMLPIAILPVAGLLLVDRTASNVTSARKRNFRSFVFSKQRA
jgi:glucose PTS system EIICBA or EIICB component